MLLDYIVTPPQEARRLKSVIEGVIVMVEVESIGLTDMKDGFITVETPDSNLIKIEVGSYTSYDTLDEGKQVSVEIESSGTTGAMYAIRVAEIKLDE